MDRFLLKRSHPSSVSSSAERSVTPPPSKRPSPAAKQGNVSALVRVAEFGSDKFYADGGKLFCKLVNPGRSIRSSGIGVGEVGP